MDELKLGDQVTSAAEAVVVPAPRALSTEIEREKDMKTLRMTSTLAALILTLTAAMAGAQALSKYDAGLINDYTARGYFINSSLNTVVDRGVPGLEGPAFLPWSIENPDKPTDEEGLNYRYVTHLNRALAKIPAHRGLAYRGIYHGSQEETPEQRFPLGKVWIERRYTSASKSLKLAESFAAGAYKNEGCGGCDANLKDGDPKNSVVLTIKSLTGRPIGEVSAKPEEQEVLFASGTLFKITKAVRDAKGRYLVEMEELAKISPADQKAFEASEAARFERLKGLYNEIDPSDDKKFRHSLGKDIDVWNRAHRVWKANGFLQRELDLEALESDGGG